MMKKDLNTLAGRLDRNDQKDIGAEKTLNDGDMNKLLLPEEEKEKRKGQEDLYENLVRDLHDTLQQTLLVLNMKLQKARVQLPEGYDSKVIDESLDYSKLALKQMKKILSGEEDAAENSLNEQLCKMVEKLSSAVDFKITFENTLKSQFPTEKAPEVLKTVDEILTNAIKYSNASHLYIRLSENPEKLFITIKDDGVGFDPEKIVEGHGMKNIRHRIERVGGVARIKSTTGKGTAIHMSMVKNG